MLGVTGGAAFDPSESLSSESHSNWNLGQQLVKTCMDTYTQSKTGLGAEIVFYYPTLEQKHTAKDVTERAWYIDKRKP